MVSIQNYFRTVISQLFTFILAVLDLKVIRCSEFGNHGLSRSLVNLMEISLICSSPIFEKLYIHLYDLFFYFTKVAYERKCGIEM